MSRRQTQQMVTMSCVHPNAAGLDLSQSEIWAAVPADRTPTPIRKFGTFTPDVLALADWLTACHIDTVAMEATGVYWIPVYEVLEAKGFEIFVVNARHVKNVPGRKSDVQDCQWIQYLHSVGLLSRSFRPDAEMATLRAYLRHRAALLESRAAHIQHMQKALQQMNVQLTQVLSDITGSTGLAIIRAIIAGDRDPQHLAHLRDRRCARAEADIAKALTRLSRMICRRCHRRPRGTPTARMHRPMMRARSCIASQGSTWSPSAVSMRTRCRRVCRKLAWT
jgi:transposase